MAQQTQKATSSGPIDPKDMEAILAFYDMGQWEALSSLLAPQLDAVGVDASVAATEALGMDVQIAGAFDIYNADAASYAEQRAAEMVGKKLVNGALVDNLNPHWAITDSTRNWLRESVQQAFEQGQSPVELAKSIQNSQAFSKYRSQMIARTEVANANLHAWNFAAVQAAMQYKRTSLSADHEQNDMCDAAYNDGLIAIGEPFSNGMMGPLFHPWCECDVTYYRKKPNK